MKHLVAILIKFAAAAVIFEAYFLLVTDLDFGQALLIAGVITLVSYALGDILIMPRAGNIVATLADLVLAFFIVYLFKAMAFSAIGIADAIIVAILTGIEEWFFHRYLAENVFNGEER